MESGSKAKILIVKSIIGKLIIMWKVLRKADLVLFFFFIALAALIAAAPLLQPAGPAESVRITRGGREFGIYPLNKDAEIEVSGDGHSNLVQIREGRVSMAHSDCKNQVCVHTGEITQAGETIVCLPNRVTVEILNKGKGGDPDDGIDAVVK